MKLHRNPDRGSMKQVDVKLALAGTGAAPIAGFDTPDLRSLLQAARTQVREFRFAVRSTVANARKPAKLNTGSNGSKGSSSSRGSDRDGLGG
jgi:hypothetical protein